MVISVMSGDDTAKRLIPRFLALHIAHPPTQGSMGHPAVQIRLSFLSLEISVPCKLLCHKITKLVFTTNKPSFETTSVKGTYGCQ